MKSIPNVACSLAPRTTERFVFPYARSKMLGGKRLKLWRRRLTQKSEREKFSRVYVIKSGSGDSDLYERLEGATAYDDEVAEFQTAVNSTSGFFYTPEYNSSDGQNIEWVWKSEAKESKEAPQPIEPPNPK